MFERTIATGCVISSSRRTAPALLIVLTAILAAVALACVKPASADRIESKRAEAQNVLAQIQEIDGQLERAVEAYNLANLKLQRIQGELKTNKRHLVIARKSLKNAQTHLSERLVALYVGGGEGTSL